MPLLIAIFIPFAGKWQRDGRYYPADSLTRDSPRVISYCAVHMWDIRWGVIRLSACLRAGANQKNWIPLANVLGFSDHDGRALRQLRQKYHAVKN